MAVAAPEPLSWNPLRRLYDDFRAERALRAPLPPGELNFSVARTRRFARDPLPILLDAYERYGPVFAFRVLHAPVVFMIGPEANHFVTVSHAHLFRWRDGSMGDLHPLIGDGLLTIDGEYHRRARRIMLPAFHRERLATAVETMVTETTAALDALRPGQEIDLYHWTRALTVRVAMRALFGFDPDRAEVDVADEFERALSYYGRDYFAQILRGPGSPWRRMQRDRRLLDRVIYAEIARRRREGGGDDILSLLMEARDEDGHGFDDRELRDQVMTLMFAGHDTTTSTVSFLAWELARHRAAEQRVVDEVGDALGDDEPDFARLTTALPELDKAVDETLRLYPPAWIGPRRSVQEFEFAGTTVPANVLVNYCSWATHRLPEVFADPEEFRPERFDADRRAALPKGAYVPFGGGSRTCIGMRFGQLEVKAIAALLLRRFRVTPRPGYELRIREMPTLSPRDGLPVTLAARG